DVAEQIAGDDNVEDFRLADEVHGGGIDEQRASLDVGKLLRNIAEDLVPQPHAMDLGVGLGDRRQLLFALAGGMKGGTHDALAAAAGEHGGLHGGLVRRASVEAAADGSVFAFGVLAVDEKVDAAGGLVAQGRLYAVEQVRRPQVDVLVELAPHGQEQAMDADG